MLDIAIIGAGPAGLSAAITGVIRNKKVKIFGNKPETSYIYKAGKIDNYIGIPNVNGKQLVEHFVNHAKELGVEIQNGKVLEILPMGNYHIINVDNQFIETKTVIITTGITKTHSIDGENNFIGKGVSYCATCDGMFYRDKNVLITGDSKETEEDIRFLSEICKKVYYVPTPINKEVNFDIKNVEIIRNKPKKIYGDNIVNGIEFSDKKLNIDGVFIINECVSTKKLINNIELDGNSIKVNKHMETSVKGIYAAGDCTGKPFQLSKATGEGNIAVLSAVSYLNKLK